MPEVPRDRPHIYLRGVSEKEPFTSPRSGPRGKPPERDREAHAVALESALIEARKDASIILESRPAPLAVGKPGLYLEFEVPEVESAALDSLENQPKGIELLSVRRSEGEGRLAATVFVPIKSAEHFDKKIEDYRTQNTKKGNPKNQALVARIENIKAATARSLFTDDPATFPKDNIKVWWEIWARKATMADLSQVAEHIQIRLKSPLSFPEREVVLAFATVAEVTSLIWNSTSVAELRLAQDTPAEFLGMGGPEQAEWVKELLGRLEDAAQEPPVAVCILDGGINREHPLLGPFLGLADLHTYDPNWGTADDDGHGTGMAGLALFGDLTGELLSRAQIPVRHVLESVKVLPPNGQANEPEAYGYITAESIARTEVAQPERPRVVCMAITSNTRRVKGRPTSWSSEIDRLCFGEGNAQRLIVLSAGNIRDQLTSDAYLDRNDLEEVEDPAQSWNALTVGAFTEKIRLTDPNYAGWQVVAPPGELSPTSRTSVAWPNQWPVKPDVVFEGGNYAADGAGLMDSIDDLCLLTTDRGLPPFFGPFNDTSAASALAARMAAMLWTYRPESWPETIRALIVHSAEWTTAMSQGRGFGSSQAERRLLIRRYGYGVPNYAMARASAANDLTLIVEDELIPFDKRDGKVRTHEMNIHRFPWPRAELEGLGGTPVELRITLSYFVEPNPGERGWTAKHRYASHGLRFEVKRPLEGDDVFRRRVNRAAWDAGARPRSAASGDDEWLLGRGLRDVGSIHSDYWRGTGAALAKRDAIGIYPSVGWWKERARLDRWGEPVRYCLIVTIRAPGAEVDIHTPVANALAVQTVTKV